MRLLALARKCLGIGRWKVEDDPIPRTWFLGRKGRLFGENIYVGSFST